MEKLKRHRRVNEEGEWEYLCSYCLTWKEKDKFKGCVDKVDGFGNCLTCRSCISKKSNELRVENLEDDLLIIMKQLGYETGNPENPVWVQFHKRHNLPY